MNAIPVFVVTGFLDSGKTTFLNFLMNKREWRDYTILVIQFETGEMELQNHYHNCHSLSFPKKVLEQQPRHIIEQIQNSVRSHHFDEIWIEWNGIVPFSQLQALLLDPSLNKLCKIQKVMHIADSAAITNLLGRTGSALPEQISSSDFIVVHNAHSPKAFKQTRNLLRNINPGVAVYDTKAYNALCRQLYTKNESPVHSFFLTVLIIFMLYWICDPAYGILKIPFNAFINIFLGIILQAIPFLLIGVLISSAIQIFIPQGVIERRFPKSLGLGMLVAIIGGFCLPVCDCASIPIFKSLVKKGIPLPVAITFMTATPVINPVVMLSTYYAFNTDITIVIERVCYGIIVSILIGLVFAAFPPKSNVLSGGKLDRLMCSCGCYEDAESITTFKGKIGLFLRHSQAEFFNIGKYMLMGTFIASLFQVFGSDLFTIAQNNTGMAISISIMMIMAFVLSLCSSSDAVIARSFANQFPMGAIMGFLVFGPMMDIKNVMMLSSGFSKRFICKLLFITFIICFLVIFLLYSIGGK